MKNTLLVLVGPTASGKTDLAIFLAKYFNTEIISADSRQLFREISIGTAKPGLKQLEEVKHHFISSHSFQDNMNAGKYADECDLLIDSLFKKHQLVILTGGSGLYIDAVVYGMDAFPDTDPEMRMRLKKEAALNGLNFLGGKLKSLDPVTYQTIDLNNPQRVIRAIEVCLVSGKPYSSFLNNKKKTLGYDVIFIGIKPDRSLLYNNINKRVDEMIALGLVDEVRTLLPFKNHTSMKTVGYVEIILFLENKISLTEAIEKIKQHTRNYAKRQLTWFNKNKSITWFDPDEKQTIINFIEKKLN